jgi:hypothetical protein
LFIYRFYGTNYTELKIFHLPFNIRFPTNGIRTQRFTAGKLLNERAELK